jgi:hypothetical protein
MVRQLTTSFGAYQIVKGRSIANSNASPNLLMGNKLILLVILFLLVSLFAGFSIFWFLYFLVSLFSGFFAGWFYIASPAEY